MSFCSYFVNTDTLRVMDTPSLVHIEKVLSTHNDNS
jgi:hypothetical protein